MGFNITDDMGNSTSLRLNYLSLKYLGRVGNDRFYFQLGPYIGAALEIKYTSNGIIDEFYYQDMRRFEVGFSTSVHQYLFSLKSLSGYIRGEVNYALSNESSSKFINVNRYDRNYTYGLGLCLRWKYKN